MFPVVEQAQRGYCARNQAKHVHQVLIGGKSQRSGAVLLPEGRQICPFVSLHRDEVVIALFIIHDEEVLGVGLWVG